MRLRRRGTAPSAPEVEADEVEEIDAIDAIDAIERLTAANRRGPDPEVERELVRLRHRAASVSVSTASAPPRPVVSGEPDGRLPSVAPADLTLEAVHEGFRTGGCLLIPGLIPTDWVDTLVDGIDQSIDAFDAAVAGTAAPEQDQWYSPFTPSDGYESYRVGGRRNWVRASGGLWTADSPRMLFLLTEVLHEVGLGDLVSSYLGERPAMSVNKCNLRRVPVTTSGAWHQDGAFLGEGVLSLNVWMALSDCGRDAPTMDVIPRRFEHVQPTGTDGIPFDWAVSPEVATAAAGNVAIMRPTFSAGDVLLFDHLFLHRTASEPTMSLERYAIETWFFAPSGYPDGQIPLLF